MPPNESYPATPEMPLHEREVLRYCQEQQAENPDFLKGVIKRLWDGMSSVQKDTMSSIQAQLIPDDLIGRRNLLQAQLVLKYVELEAAGLRQLDESLASLITDIEDSPDADPSAA